jgi:hypothetical protein
MFVRVLFFLSILKFKPSVKSFEKVAIHQFLFLIIRPGTHGTYSTNTIVLNKLQLPLTPNHL